MSIYTGFHMQLRSWNFKLQSCPNKTCPTIYTYPHLCPSRIHTHAHTQYTSTEHTTAIGSDQSTQVGTSWYITLGSLISDYKQTKKDNTNNVNNLKYVSCCNLFCTAPSCGKSAHSTGFSWVKLLLVKPHLKRTEAPHITQNTAPAKSHIPTYCNLLLEKKGKH